MAPYCNILAWKISWAEKPGGLQSLGPQRVEHDHATEHTHTQGGRDTMEQHIYREERKTNKLSTKISISSKNSFPI